MKIEEAEILVSTKQIKRYKKEEEGVNFLSLH